MGFQNIIKLLKFDKQNLDYRHLKLKPLRYMYMYGIWPDSKNKQGNMKLNTYSIFDCSFLAKSEIPCEQITWRHTLLGHSA